MSEILDLAHDMAKDIHAVGAMDVITMRMMDELCLPKQGTFAAAEIRRNLTAVGRASKQRQCLPKRP